MQIHIHTHTHTQHTHTHTYTHIHNTQHTHMYKHYNFSLSTYTDYRISLNSKVKQIYINQDGLTTLHFQTKIHTMNYVTNNIHLHKIYN